MELPCRRFGRTNLNMPVLSLGGMRFQKSWDELKFSEISRKEQNKDDFFFNQDIDYDEGIRSPGWARLQKRKLKRI